MDVVLGPGNKVLAHGVVCSGTRMATGNEVHYHAVIGHDPSNGVVDRHNRIFGYQNLLVCDGAAMPGLANGWNSTRSKSMR